MTLVLFFNMHHWLNVKYIHCCYRYEVLDYFQFMLVISYSSHHTRKIMNFSLFYTFCQKVSNSIKLVKISNYNIKNE